MTICAHTESKRVSMHEAIKPCRLCPAMRPLDEEAQDMRDWLASGLIAPAEFVYPCAWNEARTCAGVQRVCQAVAASMQRIQASKN